MIKEIPEFTGYYASDKGEIFSCKFGDMRQMKDSRGQHGYRQVGIYKNGKQFSRRVHSLVMLAFKGECPKGMQVAHNDGDRLNNKLSNLRYDTPLNNTREKSKHGVQPRGSQLPFAKLNGKQVRVIKHIKNIQNHIDMKQIAKIFGVSNFAIFDIWHERAWKHIKI